jgi:DNA-binding response OmpR family regulator
MCKGSADYAGFDQTAASVLPKWGMDVYTLMRLLILEDDPKLLAILSHHFTVAGHDVRTATNLRQATTALASTPADIVITDGKLPEASGKELCRSLRRHARQSMYLIVLTSPGIESTIGADECIAKPVELHRLATSVRNGMMQISAKMAA